MGGRDSSLTSRCCDMPGSPAEVGLERHQGTEGLELGDQQPGLPQEGVRWGWGSLGTAVHPPWRQEAGVGAAREPGQNQEPVSWTPGKQVVEEMTMGSRS